MFAKLLCRVLVAGALGLGLIGVTAAQQVVRVGSTPTGIPFTFLDTKTNQISGIMVDIIKEIKVYDSIPDIIRDVNVGRIKGGFADYPIVAYQIAQGGYPESRVAKNYKSMLVGSVGIAVRKGDKAMLDKVNASLRKMKADGTIDKILANWGLK